MDREIPKQRFGKKQMMWIISAIAILLLIVYLIVKAGTASPVIAKDKIKIAAVRFGEFQEIILVNGSLEPRSTFLIDAREGGTVVRIFKEEGTKIKAGEPLVELSNESVKLDFMQRETQMVEQINNLRNTRIALFQNQRRTEDQVTDFSNQLVLAERSFKTDSGLMEIKAISQQQFFETRNQFAYLKQKVATEKRRLNEDLNYQRIQIDRIDESLTMMERNLNFIREKLSNILVEAGAAGQLNNFNLEIGQVLQRNQMIGRIDDPDRFMIRAQVDQHYLRRIAEGQKAFIMSGETKYEMIVQKVYPTVEQGSFRVDLFFISDNSVPENLNRGRNFQVHIEAGAQKKSLFISRGAFFQSSGGQFVYVVGDDGRTAWKRTVRLGAQNPGYYEVTDGLAEGETVIISGYDGFKNHDKIRIE